jgi:hypothetical protein
MLILCDNKMPSEAKAKLSAYGEIVDFATEGITYDAISGHPDIFFCPTPEGLIVAPNLPEKYLEILKLHEIQYVFGRSDVGYKYPESALYNSLVTDRFIIQNKIISDKSIRKLNPDPEIINVKQGYVRCNLLALPNGTFITSDRGMEKSLRSTNLEVLFVDPDCVKLEGFDHGFLGGTCGMFKNTLFVCGNLTYFKEQAIIESFIERAGVLIIELYEGQPVDVGTIMFLFTE